MGYRLYLGSFPKERLNYYLVNYKVGELNSKLYNSDYDDLDENPFYNEFWSNFTEYFECSNFFDFVKNHYKNCIDFDDNDFMIVTKDNLKEYLYNFDKYYAEKLVKQNAALNKLCNIDNINELTSDEKAIFGDLLLDIRKDLFYFTGQLDNDNYHIGVCDISENKYRLTCSDRTKHFIFDIVNLIKNFDWKNNYCVLIGY